MIEVRIPHRSLLEYSTDAAANAYILGRVMAAGIPITPRTAEFTRDGILEGEMDPITDCVIFRWYECDEIPTKSKAELH
jgi:hypothetical protein